LSTALLQRQLSDVEFHEDVMLQEAFKRFSVHVWQQLVLYKKNRSRKDLIIRIDGGEQLLKLSNHNQTYGIASLQGIDSLMTRCRHGLITIKCYDSIQRDCVYSKVDLPLVKPGALVLVDKEQGKLLCVYRPEEETLLIQIGEVARDFIPNRNYRWPSNDLVYR